MAQGGEQKLNPGLRKYYRELTLDSNTAHRLLKHNNWKVENFREEQYCPDQSERFDHWLQLMCKEPLIGQCYWEVEWSGWVDISVTYEGINRKGGGEDSQFGGNDQSWSLNCSDKGCYVWHKNIVKDISSSSPFKGKAFGRVAVYLDQFAHELSFYRAFSDRVKLLHTFKTTSTRPVYAGFGFNSDESSIVLCSENPVK